MRANCFRKLFKRHKNLSVFPTYNNRKVSQQRVMTCITQHDFPITQAKMALSQGHLSHRFLKK
jgi:hypothetical protein